MGLFDWVRRRPHGPDAVTPVGWHVYLDGDDVVAEDGRGGIFRASRSGARNVRIVPLTGGDHHANSGGWQVALGRTEGDVLLGKPLPEWQVAHALARQVCEATELPLDELTRRMFSKVGQFAPRA